MSTRKRPWDLWAALGLLILVLVRVVYFPFTGLVPLGLGAGDQTALSVLMILLLLVLTIGLILRHAWAWWLCVVLFSMIALSGIRIIALVLDNAGYEILLDNPQILLDFLSPVSVVTIVVLLIVSRFRGTYNTAEKDESRSF